MQSGPRKGVGPEVRKLSGIKVALLRGAASCFSFFRSTSSTSSCTWIVKCVQHSSGWAFSCVTNMSTAGGDWGGKRKGNSQARGNLSELESMSFWVWAHKGHGTREGSSGLCKECRITRFSLNLSCIISAYLFFYSKKPGSQEHRAR